ncbi:MAG: FlgD immunoglobulin-like domain containing protein [Candidatus Gracilibacteria bacterium]|jgi:flagellar hook assembly protein FlgD
MFKKIVSLLASVAVLATMTATTVSAATLQMTVSASPSTFNPAKSESTAITLTTNIAVPDMYAYALNRATYEVHVFPVMNHVAVSAGTRTFTWYGRSGNTSTGTVLADGQYILSFYAKTANTPTAGLMGYSQSIVVLDSTQTPQGAPVISGFSVNPTSFMPNGGGSTLVSFTTNVSANLTVVVEKEQVNGGYATVNNIGNTNTQQPAGSYSVAWDGKDSTGATVASGKYSIRVTATNSAGTITQRGDVTVGQTSESTTITNFTLDPSATWDPSDDVLQIDFELNNEVDSLTIEARKGNSTVEILDDSNVDNDDYEEEWDGTDEDGDYVSGGLWSIVIIADGQSVTRDITIAYEQPNVNASFVTKESFDPTKDESTTLVYKVDTASVVTVEVYQGTHREATLIDEQSVSKNKWYSVEFDGVDENGDEVDEGSDYKFKITAQNSTDDDVKSTQFVNFSVEEDEVSTGKSNVTNDVLAPAIYDDTQASNLELSYCLDESAEVFAAIYKGTSAGSNAKIELMDYVGQTAGCHTVSWNGKDKDNKTLDDGMYTYKVISRTENGKKDNEVGKFVIGNAGGTSVTPRPDPGSEYSCSMYIDLYNAEGTELCDAVGWVTERGIFHGYTNGAFMPYQNITRAEVLKVVLEAFEATLFPANGSNLGFSDLNPYGWYMTYLRTAQFYGMLEGYQDGTAKPENNINRVEALKFVLEASETFTGQLLTGGTASYADVDFGKWYAKYVGAAYTYQLFDTDFSYGNRAYLHPTQLVQRGEFALMLYRLNKAGFIR